MLNKLKAIWEVFEAGKSVADPVKWKRHQIGTNAIAALLVAIVSLAKAFGYDFGIDTQMCTDVAVGITTMLNICFTISTTEKLGLPPTPVREAEPPVPNPEQPTKEESSAVQVEDTSDGKRGDVVSTIDDDVRARAIAWAREHSATNGLENNA